MDAFLQKHPKVHPFPSPCGEKVGINVMKFTGTDSRYLIVSVPLRGKGRDQQEFIDYILEALRKVSVPLRGKGRDQPQSALDASSHVGCVSVPLRGKGRDQRLKGLSPAGLNVQKEFPSPCGEKVGINSQVSSGQPTWTTPTRFRPLAGKR